MPALVLPGPQSAHATTRRSSLLLSAFALFLASALCTTGLARAQAANPTQVLNASALHPPAGARVAIVEFDDLQCPSCAAANPALMQAAATYHIPWVRHDFLIPGHNWSRIAAINARWFDSHSKALGDEYRNQVFAAQQSIYNPDSLRQFTEKFAQSHSLSIPFAIDPQGKFAAAVDADVALGNLTGVPQHPHHLRRHIRHPQGPTPFNRSHRPHAPLPDHRSGPRRHPRRQTRRKARRDQVRLNVSRQKARRPVVPLNAVPAAVIPLPGTPGVTNLLPRFLLSFPIDLSTHPSLHL